MRFFKKELADKPFMLKNGKLLTFTHVVDQTGLVEVGDDNPELLNSMLAAVGKAGITEITSEKADELKKKSPTPRFAPPLQTLRLHEQRGDPFSKPVVQSPSREIMTAQPGLARPVTVQESAKPAAVESPAVPAVAADGSQPKSNFVPRTGSRGKRK